MITVINGDLIAANQIAEELGRRYFGNKFFHWHSDLNTIWGKFWHRDIAPKGALIKNFNEPKDLETLIGRFDNDNAIKDNRFGVIITTECTFDKTEDEENKLWCLPLLCSFQLITVKQY